MKRLRNSILAGISIASLEAICLHASYAQDAIALPSIEFPPYRATYAVDIMSLKNESSDSGGESDRRRVKVIRRIEITISGNVQRWVSEWSDGNTTETWIAESSVISESPYGDWLNVFDLRQAEKGEFFPIRREDFENIPEQDYKGIETIEGRQCHRFEHKPENQELRIIWVDSKTLLPVKVNDGFNEYIFHFAVPASATLELPEKYQEALKNSASTIRKNY